MELGQYAESLRRELLAVTKFAGEDVARAAEMISGTLDSSVRLALLDVLSAAAEEITASLDGVAVDVRLAGSQPEFVVSVHNHERAGGAYEPAADTGDEAGSARVTLRLPESLKASVETAAASAGISVNAWLVRTISRSLETPARPGRPSPLFPPSAGRKRPGTRYTGFARS